MKQSAILSSAIFLVACSAWTPMARAATDTQKAAAIRSGLDYLYKTQEASGFWSSSGYERAATGAASFAFLSQQDKWGSESTSYQSTVDKAISYLLSEAHIADVSTRDDGVNICPDGTASCKGITWRDNADSIYT